MGKTLSVLDMSCSCRCCDQCIEQRLDAMREEERERKEIEEAEEGVDITAGALDAEEETLERCRWLR